MDSNKQTVIKVKITPRSAKIKQRHDAIEEKEDQPNDRVKFASAQKNLSDGAMRQNNLKMPISDKEKDIQEIQTHAHINSEKIPVDARGNVTDWLQQQDFAEKEAEVLAQNVNFSNNNDVRQLENTVTPVLEEREKRSLSTPISDFERYEIASIRKRYPSANSRDGQILPRIPKNHGYLDSLRLSFDQIKITGRGMNRDRRKAWALNSASTSESVPSDTDLQSAKQLALTSKSSDSALGSCKSAIADLQSESQRRKFNISIVDLDYSGSHMTVPSTSTQSMPSSNQKPDKPNYYYLYSLSNKATPGSKSTAKISEKKSKGKHLNGYTYYNIVNKTKLSCTDYASQIRQTSMKLDFLARKRRNIPAKMIKGQPGHVEIRMYRKALYNGQL